MTKGGRMTNEEAINELRDASDNEVRYGDTDNHYNEVMKRVEAFDVAIKVLEHKPCEDCISRQKAIDAIDALYLDGDSSVSYLADAKGDTLIGKYQAITTLDDLPSVTPQQKTGHWIKVDDEEPVAYDCSECLAMVSRKYNYCPCCGSYNRGGR